MILTNLRTRARINGVIAMVVLLACKSKDRSPLPANSEIEAGAPSSAKVQAKASRLPSDPPAPLAAKVSEVPELEQKLLEDKAYVAVWTKRADLNMFLSAVAQLFENTGGSEGDASISEDLFKELDKKKLSAAFLLVGQIGCRKGALPDDFAQRLTAHLDVVRAEPEMGVWANPKTGPKWDYSALAWFLKRESIEYSQEFLLARAEGGFDWSETAKPQYPWLTREKAALERYQLLAPLSAPMAARLDELRASKLGDDAPDRIDLADLLSGYHDNELRADEKYKGKVIEFKGTVGDVRQSSIGGITVNFGSASSRFMHAHCFFDALQAKKVSALSRGDRVWVRGRVQGLMMDVLVQHCEIH
jgi:tRNA_anti-like